MSSRKNKPQWWQVYAMLPVLAGLFLLEMRLPLSSTGHIIAQVGILVLVYSFIHIWLRVNRRALMGLDEESGKWMFRVYEFPPVEKVGKRMEERPIFQIPDAGLKGVLSTTFEMDEREQETAFPAGSEVLYSEELLTTKDTKQ